MYKLIEYFLCILLQGCLYRVFIILFIIIMYLIIQVGVMELLIYLWGFMWGKNYYCQFCVLIVINWQVVFIDVFLTSYDCSSYHYIYNLKIQKQHQKTQKLSKMSEKYYSFQGIKLGYYGIRGKAQVCRLLCEYMHLPYIDILFTPQTWDQFKKVEAANWNYQQLPFLKYNDILVTETFPICLYLINLANRKELLGVTVADEAQVDMFVWDNQIMTQILGIVTSVKDGDREKKKEALDKYWNEHLRDRLLKLQQKSTQTFYLPYLTIVDFYIYDLFYFLKLVAPAKFNEFPKLGQIFYRVANIPQIVKYENSNKAVKEICPTAFCQKWKEKCIIKKFVGIFMGCSKDKNSQQQSHN